ncbi:FIST C-terminal domain-containing protein [Candidatus Woesearchaeota archaeon]|nr:FIST C-terminal domain-containing protein [Candidatus Woesearchaeota archaeon]
MGKNVKSGIGVSELSDSYSAAKEACEKAAKQCGKPPSFAFVFVGSNHDLKKLNKGLKESLNCDYVGCTTCGELSNAGLTRHTCTVLALSTKYIKAGIGVGKGVLKNPVKATEAALKASLSGIKLDRYLDPYVNFMAMKCRSPSELVKMQPYSLMVFTPGLGTPLSVDNDAVISTINKVVGRFVPVIGAGSSSDQIFVNKHILTPKGVFSDAIVTLFIVSDVRIGFGLAHGLKPMKDKVAYVTKKNGEEITQLDNINAVKRYKDLTGVDLGKWTLNPETIGTKMGSLFLRRPFALQTVSGNYIIRHLLAERPQKSLRFCFSVPDKAALIPMDGNLDEIGMAGHESIQKALDDAGSDKVVATVAFSCLLRQMVQGKNTVKEIEAIRKAVKDTPFAGFYSVGEISFFEDSPITSQQLSIVTMVITDTLLSEKK